MIDKIYNDNTIKNQKEDFDFLDHYTNKNNYTILNTLVNKNEKKLLLTKYNLDCIKNNQVYNIFKVNNQFWEIVIFNTLVFSDRHERKYIYFIYKSNKYIPRFILTEKNKYQLINFTPRLITNNEFNEKYELWFYWKDKEEVIYLFSKKTILNFFKKNTMNFYNLYIENGFIIMSKKYKDRSYYENNNFFTNKTCNIYNKSIEDFTKIINIFEN